MTLFPLFLKLDRHPCLLAGAGRVGDGKLRSLLRAGGRVTVVAPRATKNVRSLAKAGKIVWHKRKFIPSDLAGMLLVVAATSSHSTNEAIFEEARLRGVLCNAVDDPRHCDFFYPAVLRRGSLQIAISTGGQSPELSSRLRRELEKQFGPEYEAWVDQLGRNREEVLARSLPRARRQQLLRDLASRLAFQRFIRNYKHLKK
jgi:precorrin-2 dehydrogenase/sirohydrochlorin ferrochelatase